MSINLKPEHANHSTSLMMDALSLNETCRQIAEMKSIQPYSTKDEYIYAMKEDLADWFNSMYATNLTANNFIDQLKNGVLICEHANNVMREAAFKSFAFRMFDLQQAGIININQLTVINNQNSNNVGNSKTNIKNLNYRSNTPTLNLKMPNGQSAFAGEYLMYNQEPKMIMIAYDNITNFIRWCRYIVKVKECLMFETEDLTLCKNEKNFILCLLEVARFGSKFGIRVPTIIQLEQEIEAEMELDKTANMITNKNEDSHFSLSKNRFIEEKQPNKEYIKSLGQNDDISSNESKSPSPSPPPPAVALTMPPEIMQEIIEPSSNNYFLNDEILTSSFSSISNSPSIDKLKDHMIHSPVSSSRSNSPMNKFIKNNNEQDDDVEQKTSSQSQNINNSDLFINNNFSPSESLSSPRSSLTSLTSSINQARDMADRTYESNDMDSKSPISPISSDFSSHLPIIKNLPETYLAKMVKPSAEKINFHSLIPNRIETKQKIASSKSPNKASKLPSRVNSTENLLENKPSSVAMSNQLMNTESAITTVTTQQHQQVNLHKHVCSIANKCTCEKKFLVDKIGEGKYRIGNTKNIVFIRILKNHIMVRVGGGWDTLENYLDKHDPCRCSSSIDSVSSSNKRYNETNVNAEYSSQQQSSNIILTPVKPTASSNSNHSGNQTGIHNSSSKGVIRVTTISCNNNSSNNNSSSNKLNSPITPNSDIIVKSKSNSNINFVTNNNNNLLKTLSPSNINSCSSANNSNNNNNSCLSYESETKRAIDFTDAHLIIERDNQGKHQIGKILLPSSTHSQLHHHNQQQHQHIQQVIHSTSANFLKYNNNNHQTNNKDGLEEQYINNNDTMHSSRNIYFLNALKHASQSQSNAEQENKNAFNLNTNNNSNISNINGIGSSSNLFNNNDNNNNLSPSINSSESFYSSANNKAESLIKNKMKKFINRIPQTVTSCSSSSYSCSNSNLDSNFISSSSFRQQASPSSTYSGLRKSASSNSSSPDPLSPSNQQSISSNSPVSFRRTPIEQQLQNTSAGLLKFTRTNFIDQMHNNQKQLQSQQIQTHHSLRVNNLDSADHLLDTPVYTETKLPPRILRKYQKERSITEAQIVSPQQLTEEKHRVLNYENEMKSSDIDCSSSSCGSALGSSLISGGTTSPSSKIISYNTNRNGIILSSGDPIHSSSSSTETASSTSSSYQSSCLSYNESSSKQIANTNGNNLDLHVSRKQQTQSPKLAIKLKGKLKKYKKSKTTDLAKYAVDGEQLDELDDEQGLEETNVKPNSNTSSDLVNSDFDSLESDSICCEPTADNISSQTNSNLLLRFVSPSPILKAHQSKPTHELENLNDSLELVSTPTENDDTKKLNDFFIQMNENDNRVGLEDDSLLINDSQQPSEPSSGPMKILSKPNRAQWDKSRQQIDLMYFNFSKLNNKQDQTKSNNQPAIKKPIKSQLKPQPQQQPAIENSAFNRKESHNRSHSQAAVSQIPNPSNTSTLPSNIKTKRVKNLNLAKEKLYEMKKTIDAKVNLDIVNSKPTRFAATNSSNVRISSSKLTANQHQHQYQQPTTNTRTTPRKVKKRSGERSLTTGIITSENNFLNTKNISASKTNGLASLKSNAMMCASNTSINSVCTNFSINTVNNNNYCKIQSKNLRSRTPNQLSSSSLSRLHKASASLHNISSCNNNTNNTDELMDNNEPSISVNCVARSIRNRHDSFSSTASSYFGLSGNANDYKENKAYELRKKSTLMNKIITKNQNQDPIYSRSHPIRSELVDQKVLDINNITLGSLGCSYEQKHSAARKRLFAKKNEKSGGFDPNVSIGSNASSSTTSTSTTTTSHNKFNSILSPVNTIPRQSRTANKNGQIVKSNKPLTPRSKSNNDLYYELERTNSAQDLIELLNNCDAPAGDLNQYKIMLSECEKLQFHINKLKTQHKIQKTKCNPPVVAIKKSPTSIPNRIKTIANEQKSSRQQAQLKYKYSLQNELNKSSLEVVEQTQINKNINEQDLMNQEKDKELFENRNNNETLNESSLTNSMHRRSHSLPSYMAIPVPTSVSRQK